MNKIAVVVGASRGIGRSVVYQLANTPHLTVYALSRNIDKMDREYASFPNISAHYFDLQKGISDQLSDIFSNCQQIDFLINNAGYLVNKPFSELSSEDLHRSYQTNVIGVMQTIQCLLPKLTHGSHVVNISSMGAFQGTVKFAGLAAYSSSKAALVNFTELFAEEFKSSKIKMNCLCLGAVQTEMFAEAFPEFTTAINSDHMAEYICRFVFDAHKWMNGKIIPVSMSTP